MDDSELTRFKERLEQLREELLAAEESSREARQPVELDQTRVGRLSRMEAMQDQQMAQEVARRRRHQLTRIDGALRRIAAREYGYCFVCGEDIGVRRLGVDPTSTRCTDCAEDAARRG